MSATATNGKPPWVDVSAAVLCPVCRKADRCKVSPRGDRVLCRRVESADPAGGGEAWFHPHPGTPPAGAGTGRPGPARPAPAGGTRPDFGRLAAGFRANLDAHPALRRELAAALGLPGEALAALPLLGWNGRAWTFPEEDAAGAVTGIALRLRSAGPDENKSGVKGSRRGLTAPAGWRDRPGPVYVCEGASDVLALTHAGLPCVGRFSNAGGADLLAALFATLPAGREVVVLGENDRKPDDSWPGRLGAQAVAGRLREALPGRAVRVALPPPGSKDARAWLTHADRDGTPWPGRGAAFAAALVPDAAAATVKERPPPAADVLAEIACEGELFHDDAGRAYAAVGPRTYPVRSKAFRLRLTNEFRKRTKRVPNAEAVGNAVTAAEAAAVHDGPERPVFARVAAHGGRVYYHLGDDASTVVEVDAAGWRACPDPPVRFARPAGMLAVPMPEPGGSLADLRRFVNCPDDDAFALLAGWLAACLRADGPFPLLVLTGEQGSAKSTTARVLKDLIDPARAPVRSAPREERDLMVAAGNGHVLAFDNLSGLPDWLSDAFCRLATGGGFGVRTLYENDEETVFEAKRPVILNGIEDVVTKPDLLERAVLLRHPAIPDGRRRLESELWAGFRAARPRLLGALLTRVSGGLRALPGVDTSDLPRMADACAFAAACEAGAGEAPRFLAAFRAGQGDGHDLALADSPVVGPLLEVMAGRAEWRGAPTELFRAASAKVPDPKPRDWPKRSNGFMGAVRRLADSLRRVHGLDVDADGRGEGRNRSRVVTVTRRPAGGRGGSSADDARPSATVRQDPTQTSAADGADDADGVSRPLSAGAEGDGAGTVPPAPGVPPAGPVVLDFDESGEHW